MAVVTKTVTATATATILHIGKNPSGDVLVITSHNNSADVYVGGSTVTASSNGIVVPKSQTYTITVPFGETIWCAGNGTDTLKVLTFNQ
jgi:hypothetical protein